MNTNIPAENHYKPGKFQYTPTYLPPGQNFNDLPYTCDFIRLESKLQKPLSLALPASCLMRIWRNGWAWTRKGAPEKSRIQTTYRLTFWIGHICKQAAQAVASGWTGSLFNPSSARRCTQKFKSTYYPSGKTVYSWWMEFSDVKHYVAE